MNSLGRMYAGRGLNLMNVEKADPLETNHDSIEACRGKRVAPSRLFYGPSLQKCHGRRKSQSLTFCTMALSKK
jgi:hypothetical protein